MTDQEIEFASGVLVVAMVFLSSYLLIWWPEISNRGKLFCGIGSIVLLVFWALIGA